jgi:uncharacterized spore protein YtfJ
MEVCSMTDATGSDLGAVSASVSEAMRGIFGDASPSSLFSSPTQVGDDLIFTAVAWERAGGFGFGSGEGQGGAGDVGSGGGGGGGGASQGRPVAVIRVTGNGVEVKPVIDFTKIGVTLLLSLIAVWKVIRR